MDYKTALNRWYELDAKRDQFASNSPEYMELTANMNDLPVNDEDWDA